MFLRSAGVGRMILRLLVVEVVDVVVICYDCGCGCGCGSAMIKTTADVLLCKVMILLFAFSWFLLRLLFFVLFFFILADDACFRLKNKNVCHFQLAAPENRHFRN